eukprot:GHVS01037806.1.p1 GENE.GHVS01037806.1~~GHVS01037806.1.p1  ORF type:complete len:438 (+),score=77.11 GHVS01037806.1:33-1316(+)
MTSHLLPPPPPPPPSCRGRQLPRGSSECAIMITKQQFNRTKLCQYGASCTAKHSTCTFAHSEAELLPFPDFRRTKLCEYSKRGVLCPLDRCLYAHSFGELQPTKELWTYKTSPCLFWRKGMCFNGHKCRFAHGPKEMRNRSQETRDTDSDACPQDNTSSQNTTPTSSCSRRSSKALSEPKRRATHRGGQRADRQRPSPPSLPPRPPPLRQCRANSNGPSSPIRPTRVPFVAQKHPCGLATMAAGVVAPPSGSEPCPQHLDYLQRSMERLDIFDSTTSEGREEMGAAWTHPDVANAITHTGKIGAEGTTGKPQATEGMLCDRLSEFFFSPSAPSLPPRVNSLSSTLDCLWNKNHHITHVCSNSQEHVVSPAGGLPVIADVDWRSVQRRKHDGQFTGSSPVVCCSPACGDVADKLSNLKAESLRLIWSA